MKKLWLSFLLFLPFMDSAQTITTIAGGGVAGDGSPATAASIYCPEYLAFDANGNLYFTEALGNKVRKVDTNGIITTIAGNGSAGFSGDGGAAISAIVDGPDGLTVDAAGNIIFCDEGNNRLRKIDAITGIITTIAGNGTPGYSGDNGPATAAMVNYPYGLRFDNNTNSLYIADNANHRVRKIDAAGIITTVAGTGAMATNGDGGQATAAACRPIDMCTDSYGNLYIADGYYTVRKVNTSGIITTIAGDTVSSVYDGDDIPAINANMEPDYVAIKGSGESGEVLYISDYTNNRVLMLDALGIIHTVAGDGIEGYSGDGGPATAAELYYAGGLAFDHCGNLYIAQLGNPRIRKVTYPGDVTTPTISITGITSALIGDMVTVTATVADASSSYIIHWLNHGIEFTTTTVPSVTYIKSASIDTITATVTPTSVFGCYGTATSAQHIVASNTNTAVNTLMQLGLSIYPNPASEIVYIDGLQTAAGYRLFSIVGSVAQQGNLSIGGNSISLQGLSTGMYMLEILDEDGERTVKKIIKQ